MYVCVRKFYSAVKKNEVRIFEGNGCFAGSSFEFNVYVWELKVIKLENKT